jgi:serine/threonine-protein kinase
MLPAITGAVKRRQGKLEEALADFKEACRLDPRSALPLLLVGQTYALLRDYPQAERYCDRLIALSPELTPPYGRKIKVLLSWRGDTEMARAVLDRAQENVDINEDDFLAHHAVLIEIFDGNYRRAQEMLSYGSSEVFDTEQYSVPKVLLRAQVSGLMGDRELARARYDSARVILEAKVQEQPEDSQFHSALGIAYAGLGREADAIREGKLAVELLPITKDAWGGLFLVENLARIYVMVGQHDAAVELIEDLLSIPGELSIPLLRTDPVWDPLHDHPRFRKLVETGR